MKEKLLRYKLKKNRKNTKVAIKVPAIKPFYLCFQNNQLNVIYIYAFLGTIRESKHSTLFDILQK
jgi:hypothetical protein